MKIICVLEEPKDLKIILKERHCSMENIFTEPKTSFPTLELDQCFYCLVNSK